MSTNAGGNRVLRYGMMRDLVMGIEAVLPSGEVVSSLNKMMKNNTGYDLKQLFIGAEGTLGVITRAVLKIYPKPRSVCTALCALKDYDGVLQLLKRARSGLGGTLSAFEVMWPVFYGLGTQDLARPPLPYGHGVYVLIDALGSDQDADQARFERVIGEAIEAGDVEDAVLAQSSRETQAMWAIRDCPGEFHRLFSPQIPFDVSIPTAQIGRFVETDLHPRLVASWPGLEAVYFGHAADSNLHLSIKYSGRPEDALPIKQVVYEAVRDWKGSVSAEHGIGLEKKKYLGYSRSPAEMALMRTIKAAIDPKGIMNPGKVFSA
jgi:FAD/FMN-containing dehydrogenase